MTFAIRPEEDEDRRMVVGGLRSMKKLLLLVAVTGALASPASVAAQPASVLARKSFTACLQRFISGDGKSSQNDDDFRIGAKKACNQQEMNLLQAMVAYDVATGMRPTDAQEGAQLAIDDIYINATDTWKSYLIPLNP